MQSGKSPSIAALHIISAPANNVSASSFPSIDRKDRANTSATTIWHN